MECGVWSVWSVECGVWSVECSVWSVECVECLTLSRRHESRTGTLQLHQSRCSLAQWCPLHRIYCSRLPESERERERNGKNETESTTSSRGDS